MLVKPLFILGIIAFGLSCNSQDPKTQIYLDENIPILEPRIFAPGLVSKEDESEFGSVFSPKGDEFYYGIDRNGKAEIWFCKYKNGKWSVPKPLLVDDNYSFNDPFLSPDGNRLYYISNHPRTEKDTIDDIDIWYSVRQANGWESPANAGMEINSDRNEYYISFTSEGTIYFASNKNAQEDRMHNFDIYKSAFVNENFDPPERLSDSINTLAYEADVFVAPDETYIIFCATRRSGLGRGDLYISFKDDEGNWKEAINMGNKINTPGHELCPFVTYDGKYLFYTSNQDIYWISTEIFQAYH